MTQNSTILERLHAYIRAIYKRSLRRGLCHFFVLIPLLWVVGALLSHFCHLGTNSRYVLLIFLILVSIISLLRRIFPPLYCLFTHRTGNNEANVFSALNKACIRFGNISVLTDRRAAEIIGNENPQIGDKLINLLDLCSIPDDGETDLLQAAITQSTNRISKRSFEAEKKDKKKNFIPLLGILLFLLLAVLILLAPATINQALKGLIHPRTTLPLPYSISLSNDNLSTPYGKDFQLEVALSGRTLPRDLTINVDGQEKMMRAVDATHFVYTFKTPRKNQQFTILAPHYKSPKYTLKVLPLPEIKQFKLVVTPPSYTHLECRTYVDPMPISVPEGSSLQWYFSTAEVDSILFIIDSSLNYYIPDKKGIVTFNTYPKSHSECAIIPQNSTPDVRDTLMCCIDIIPDEYPVINLLPEEDSSSFNILRMQGTISDDYGFSAFHLLIWQKQDEDTTWNRVAKKTISLGNTNSQNFDIQTSLNELITQPGMQIRYCVEVTDNDAVHHGKSVRSAYRYRRRLTQQEMAEKRQEAQQSQQRKSAQLDAQMAELLREIEQMQRRLLESKEMSWEHKRQLKQMIEKHQELINELQELRQEMMKQLQDNQFENKTEDKPKEELQNLLQQKNDEDMLRQLEQMQKLLDQNQKDKIRQQLEQLKTDDSQLRQELSQDMNLMKREMLSERVENIVQRLDSLASKQNKIANEETKDKQQNLLQQQKVSSEFQQIKEELKDIQKEFQKLDQNTIFKPDQNIENQIDELQKAAEQNLQKNKNSQAQQQQHEAADQMEKLAEQVAQSHEDDEERQTSEDAETIRRLLRNLLTLSFRQESLISSLHDVNIQDPKYQTILYNQNLIRDDFHSVNDSLQQICNRQVSVAKYIGKEVATVNRSINNSVNSLLQYNQGIYGNTHNTAAAKPMQESMTSLNNLALLMAQSLDKMQDQQRQNNKKPNCNKPNPNKNNSQCSKPGTGKPNPSSLRKMQEQLNKQMEDMKKELEKQGKSSQQKQGQRTKLGEGNKESEAFARMAAEQQRIREMMQEYAKQIKQNSPGNARLAKEIEDLQRQMEQTETDLVNRTITQQTIRRQQNILTRLLEHEKADLQQEKEEKRQSNEALDILHTSPNELPNSQLNKHSSSDPLAPTAPRLTDYYRKKVDAYMLGQ